MVLEQQIGDNIKRIASCRIVFFFFFAKRERLCDANPPLFLSFHPSILVSTFKQAKNYNYTCFDENKKKKLIYNKHTTFFIVSLVTLFILNMAEIPDVEEQRKIIHEAMQGEEVSPNPPLFIFPFLFLKCFFFFFAKMVE